MLKIFRYFAEKSKKDRFDKMVEKYISECYKPGMHLPAVLHRTEIQCKIILDFLASYKIAKYSELTRNIVLQYPAWRNTHRKDGRPAPASADTINKELDRMGAIIKHGIKFCGWQERFLLDGIKIKRTPENTKAIKPFKIEEVKAIFKWLREYSERTSNWHLHDMLLLSVSAGLEAKALHYLCKEWFNLDLGILRVYDKLISGVINAKTQNRSRDIPLTPTLRKIYERGYIFTRPEGQRKSKKEGGAPFNSWAEGKLEKAQKETGIKDINLHRFRHTCATAHLSAGWQLVRVSRMLGHSNISVTASHYAKYDLSASPEGFEGMVKVYQDFVRWLDEGYFG
jgi:integrase